MVASGGLYLGLESSCDDSAAAIVQVLPDHKAKVLSSIVIGQSVLHRKFGGVVPEVAARAHAERMDICVTKALAQARKTLSDVDVIGVTAGPGLIGGVLSGVMSAKGLALGLGKPLIGVNHLAGHALTPRMTGQVNYPYLMLLVSGGHCQFLIVKSAQEFHRLGGTIDDAPGEAFDKVARLLGLQQPGGPEVEKKAQNGDPNRFRFPRPLLDRVGCDLSFSGLKTAVLRARDTLIEDQGGLYDQDRSDFCASFQAAVADVLMEKSRRAIEQYLHLKTDQPTLAVAGGVAANSEIRQKLQQLADELNLTFIAPPLQFCTDNAAMIAYAAAELDQLGVSHDMTLSARPRWPLDEKQTALLGGGKKGAKA